MNSSLFLEETITYAIGNPLTKSLTEKILKEKKQRTKYVLTKTLTSMIGSIALALGVYNVVLPVLGHTTITGLMTILPSCTLMMISRCKLKKQVATELALSYTVGHLDVFSLFSSFGVVSSRHIEEHVELPIKARQFLQQIEAQGRPVYYFDYAIVRMYIESLKVRNSESQ